MLDGNAAGQDAIRLPAQTVLQFRIEQPSRSSWKRDPDPNSWMVAQTPSEDQKAALQEKLAALKESMAKNQQALARYSWK